ncbi:inositol monophosphatase family protein [Corynebacterium qintianiae]|uniref:inositol monophosphatase family protein n=1 Tax=Corynebacterium qintianiae TaxID=2709392 RepID=UPI0013EBB1EF|nr:inositol monophosphatase family protein [Corynebacterium qintianiae]
MAVDVNELRCLCADIATRAAELVKRQRANLAAAGELTASGTKSSDVDPVTVVDKASEELIVGEIAKRRPGDGILGEEGTDTASTTGVEWIIDPIDGTVNFLYGVPHYAVSIGVVVDGELAAGAVCNPATGELFTAAAGQGATLTLGTETTRLRASAATEVARCLVATGFSYSSEWRADQANILTSVLPAVRDIRRAGSAALDLCAVAAGRVDAYYEHGTHPWDYAAGALIASESGAVVRHPGLRADGAEGGLTAAAAPGVWADFSALLRRAGADAPLHKNTCNDPNVGL